MDIQTLIAAAKDLEAKEEYQSAINVYQKIAAIDNTNIDIFYKIGELNYALGQLTEALTAFIRVTDLDKDHNKAKVNIEMIRSILDFFNPDLYNP